MAPTPDEVADEMTNVGVDPALSVAGMVRVAKRLGVRAQTSTLKAAAAAVKKRSGQNLVDRRPPNMCTRSEAAGMLGLSVKRVDQLRVQGRLTAIRHPYTGHVWVDLDSVRQERGRRGLDRLIQR